MTQCLHCTIVIKSAKVWLEGVAEEMVTKANRFFPLGNTNVYTCEVYVSMSNGKEMCSFENTMVPGEMKKLEV